MNKFKVKHEEERLLLLEERNKEVQRRKKKVNSLKSDLSQLELKIKDLSVEGG